jgi:hypothetical protein
MSSEKLKSIFGWSAAVCSTGITSFWSFWGINENFHEGWFYESFWQNVGLMFVQYLSPMLVFLSVALVSIRFPRLGSGLHFTAGALVFWYFGGINNQTVGFFILLPFVVLGLLYWFGEPHPKRWAYVLALGLPLLILPVFGIVPAIRVAGRFNDRDFGERLIEGNGVRLVWAGEGEGFPERGGKSWDEAIRQCRHLGADGKTLMNEPQNVWRLPTVDEAVRSASRSGENSGGVWNTETKTASYKATPDKESPLWNPNSMVIYRWTATEIDNKNAYMIVYHGQVWARNKRFAPAYFAFRCVKNP